jgi:hypothetical protein
VVLSGHWSIEHNIAAIRETGEVFRRRHPATGWLLLTDQEVVPRFALPAGTRGQRRDVTPYGDTPTDLVVLDKAFETDWSLRTYYAEEPEHLRRRRETPHRYIGVNPASTDASNDPERATIERGQVLLEAIVERVVARAQALLVEDMSSESH